MLNKKTCFINYEEKAAVNRIIISICLQSKPKAKPANKK